MRTLNPGYSEEGDGISISPEGRYRTASPTPARRFIAELETDESISVAAPTPPDTFPAGQPAVLLSITADVRPGRCLLTAIFSMSIENNDPANEYEPRLVFTLWVDGVPLERAQTTLDIYSPSVPSNLQAVNVPGVLRKRTEELEEGEHVFELRWGIQGKLPAATAYVVPSLYDSASLEVQEI